MSVPSAALERKRVGSANSAFPLVGAQPPVLPLENAAQWPRHLPALSWGTAVHVARSAQEFVGERQ